MGRLMSVSSGNWLYVWMGLEINLLSFIPLIICNINELEVEGSLKYFLVQALGSSLILFSCFCLINYHHVIPTYSLSTLILVFSFIIKIGIFPFHYWLPHVIGSIGWISCILLAIWQKFGPLFIISGILNNLYCWLLLIVGSIGSFIGGVGGINQRQIRILLAYSSIGHIGWILIGILCSFNILLFYYLIYRFITLSIIIFLYIHPINIINLINFGVSSPFFILFLSILFFSLGGLPPFLGFYPKLIVISTMVLNNIYIYLVISILGSLINIFYYINVFSNLFIKSILSGFNNMVLDTNIYTCLALSIFLIFRTYRLGLFL